MLRPLAGVELYWGHTSSGYPTHVASEHKLAKVSAGTKAFYCRGVQQLVRPGAIMVVEPGESHGGQPYGVGFDVSMLALASDRIGRRRKRTSIVEDGQLAERFERACQAVRARSAALLLDELLLDMIDALGVWDEHTAGSEVGRAIGEHTAVMRACEYVRAHVDQPVTLEQLARAAGLPVRRFRGVFRREVGVPPHGFQVALRVERAKSLLGRGASLTRAALEAGFYDQAHLHRHFQRLLGVTPGEYRSACGKTYKTRSHAAAKYGA